jgi:hypothetical protein
MTRIRQRTEVMDRIYRTRLGIQVLINAVTGQVYFACLVAHKCPPRGKTWRESGCLLVRRQGGPRSQVAATGISSPPFSVTSRVASLILEMTKNPMKTSFCRWEAVELGTIARITSASNCSGISKMEVVVRNCKGFRPPNRVLPTRLCSSNLD